MNDELREHFRFVECSVTEHGDRRTAVFVGVAHGQTFTIEANDYRDGGGWCLAINGAPLTPDGDTIEALFWAALDAAYEYDKARWEARE